MKRLVPVLILSTLFVLPTRSNAAVSTAPPNLAFTRHNNVALMTAQGDNVQALTTRGTGYTSGSSVVYPSYSWSPDGRYLLMVKLVMHPRSQQSEMLLFNQRGRLLRSLGIIADPIDFYPNWAVDGDQIAYLASLKQASPKLGVAVTVNRIDLAGHRSFLFTYYTQEGCGGGTGDPAAQVYWGETGFGESTPSMQWSLARHVAVHSSGCGAGLRLVDTRTHRARVLSYGRATEMSEAALSSTGQLAAVVDSIRAGYLVHRIALVDTDSGAVQRIVGPGELPSWNHDSSSLFYVARTRGQFLHMRDQFGSDTGSQTYWSAIWRSDASGRNQTRLLLRDAYGFGSLNVTSQGNALIFSQVDNAWALYRDYRHGHLTRAQAELARQRDRPAVRIERLDIGRRATTLARNAGHPVLGPH